MKVQNLPTPNLPRTLSGNPGPGDKPPAKDPYADFAALEGDKHRGTYEAAYNLSRGLAFAVEGGARIGQTMQLGSSLFGVEAGPLAGSIGIVGGTIDVARGASMAQQSAINRNTTGAVLGGLQVAQGVATWVSAGAALGGAPVLVSQLAAGAALAAYAGRHGYAAYAKSQTQAGKTDKAPQGERPQVSVELDPKAKPHGEGRLLEKTFAAAKAVSDAAGQFGGMAAGWNNVSGVWSGSAPTGIWQGLGLVGSTYTVLQSASQVARSAGNQHLEDTLAGTIGIVQGAASLAVNLGVGGRLLPGIAVGAYLLKSAVPLLQLKKRLGANDDGGEGDGMMNRLKENIGYVFSGQPEQAPTETREIKRQPPAEEARKDAESQDEPKK